MTLCIATSITGCASRKAPTVPAPQAQSTSPQAAPAAAPSDQQSVGWATTPLPIASEPVAVKEGPAPLFYLVESPGMFRVFDQTTGLDVARAAAPGRSVVRVDGRTGVVIAGETLAPGPLARDHRYVIYREPQGPNISRQGVFQLTPHRSGTNGGTARQAAQSQTGMNSKTGGRESEGDSDASQ